MKHKIGFNRLGRKPSHRESLQRNMVTSLFRYERIKTTKTKAQSVRRIAEKMITRAKEDSVHNRREIAKRIKDKEILAKLFTELGPRFKERAGGYTRIYKLGQRIGDASEMVILELLTDEVEKKAKKTKKKTAPAKAKAPAKEESKEDTPAVAKEEKAPAKDEPKAKEEKPAAKKAPAKAEETKAEPAKEDVPAKEEAKKDAPAEPKAQEAAPAKEDTEKKDS
jgi:large subunit ribosomal protein L17